MGTVTTTYDVVTRYMTEHHGGPALQQMTTQVQALERSASSAHSMFGKIGTVVAGYFGVQQANRNLLEYNSTMEQARLQMAGMMAQAGRGNFQGNLGVAATLMRQMRDDAAKTVGTTQDYVNMASMLVQPLTMAGASIENLRDMTRQTVVASRAMGIDAAVSARDVDQAIRGVYHSVDQFTGKLLTPLGYGGEEGRRKFNAMTMQQRLAEVQRALGSKAIADMAAAQETSFEGVTSTTKSILQEMLGKVGLPLFEEIKKKLYEWNDWLQKNERKVDEIAKLVGGTILDGFRAIKDVTFFIAEHWKSVALTWGALKAAGFLAQGAGMAGGVSGVAGVAGAAGQMAGATLSQKIAVGSIVASAILIGGIELSEWIKRRQDEGIKLEGATGLGLQRQVEAAMNNPAKVAAMMNALTQSGLMSGDSLNRAVFERAMSASDLRHRGEWANLLGVHRRGDSQWLDEQTDPTKLMEAMVRWVDRWKTPPYNMMDDVSKPWRMPGGKDVPMPTVEKPKVNVTIHKIEVASDDPDRFSFNFVESLRDVARNPTGASGLVRVLREG